MPTSGAVDRVAARCETDVTAGLASNDYGEHSLGKYSMFTALLTEAVMTMMFPIIMGSTDKRVPQGFAPLAIGLGLTLIDLIRIPVTNTSVNPASNPLRGDCGRRARRTDFAP